jgi:hypothetical protein
MIAGLLDSPIKLNVLSLQESKGLELDEFDSHLKPFGISRALLASLIDTFAHAKTFGSLIQIPEALDGGLPALADGIGEGDSVWGCFCSGGGAGFGASGDAGDGTGDEVRCGGGESAVYGQQEMKKITALFIDAYGLAR